MRVTDYCQRLGFYLYSSLHYHTVGFVRPTTLCHARLAWLSVLLYLFFSLPRYVMLQPAVAVRRDDGIERSHVFMLSAPPALAFRIVSVRNPFSRVAAP
jgi:hypothetical protein